MKKSIIIFSLALTTLSLTALGLFNWNDTITNNLGTSCSKSVPLENPFIEDIFYKVTPDFFYNVGTRFRPIKRGDVHLATSFSDFIPENEIHRIMSYQSVKVIILDDNRQTDVRATGNTEILNTAQIELLKSVDYSTNILIRADFQEKNQWTNELENNYSTPYLTIVPEKQAEYVKGNDALIEYLKENSKEKTEIVQENKLKPGKLYFTVTKEGGISSVKLATTSGYPSIDKTMIELITDAPGEWKPAENAKGEQVDQKLVFSFGLIGC